MSSIDIINSMEVMQDRKKHRCIMEKIEKAMHLITEAVEETMELCGGLPEEETEQREALYEAINYLDYANEEADKAYENIFQIY